MNVALAYLLLAATFLALCVAVSAQEDQIDADDYDVVTRPNWPPRKVTITYELRYNQTCRAKSPPRPVKITTNYGTNGQEIMEIAARHNKRYSFTARFGVFGSGYSIDVIDGVEDDRDTNCFWLLYVGTKFGVSLSPVGITGWIPFPDSKIIWDYTDASLAHS